MYVHCCIQGLDISDRNLSFKDWVQPWWHRQLSTPHNEINVNEAFGCNLHYYGRVSPLQPLQLILSGPLLPLHPSRHILAAGFGLQPMLWAALFSEDVWQPK
jgi:hypothetical protein